MNDREGIDDHHPRPRKGSDRAPMAIAAVVGVLLAALGVASCGDNGNGMRFWQRAETGNGCPRPASRELP